MGRVAIGKCLFGAWSVRQKRLGLSQQALAEELHMVRQTISKWEKNLSVPDADALTRLAEALETTVQALLLLLGYAATVDVGSMQESVVQLTE